MHSVLKMRQNDEYGFQEPGRLDLVQLNPILPPPYNEKKVFQVPVPYHSTWEARFHLSTIKKRDVGNIVYNPFRWHWNPVRAYLFGSHLVDPNGLAQYVHMFDNPFPNPMPP